MTGHHFVSYFNHSIFLLPPSYAFYPLWSLCELRSHPSLPKAGSFILSFQASCELPSDSPCHPSGSLCDVSNEHPQCCLVFLPAASFIFWSLFSEFPMSLCHVTSWSLSCPIFNLWVALRCPHSFLLSFLLFFLPAWVHAHFKWDWGKEEKEWWGWMPLQSPLLC